ncbi:hypothetical protein [Parafilimonas sp.]|uniref:hypothetical protein n=1 Tax=Parafilimonas sp. TaxID=1969739 RepID=UPI0039E7293F
MINFELVITRQAQINIDEIFVWYEEQPAGLGKKFIHGFEEILITINRNPYYASNIEKEARSASMKRFPYEAGHDNFFSHSLSRTSFGRGMPACR